MSAAPQVPPTSIAGGVPVPQAPPATGLAAEARTGNGKGSGKAPTVPRDFAVDADARYTGVVGFYSKLRGYGIIEVAQKGVVPDDRLFVQWRNIQSEDRFPFLTKGLEVEFGVLKWRDYTQRGQVTLRAKTVTLPGGGTIRLQDDVDAQKKTFVGGQQLRYTGTLKFYNPKAGYGYITVDPGYSVEGATIPAELRVERSEINAGGKQPVWMQDLHVEFGIWTTSRGVQKAYNVTLPGGVALTQPALEHRQAVTGQTFRGQIQLWNWKQGWGFIKADPATALPPHVQAKLEEQTKVAVEKAAAKGKQGGDEQLLYVRRADVAPAARLQKGSQVMFQIYVDDKGAGAFDVQTI